MIGGEKAMDDTLLLILLTAVGFLAVILSLAVGKSANSKITGTCACIAIVVGVIFYSYGYAYHEGFSPSVVIRTPPYFHGPVGDSEVEYARCSSCSSTANAAYTI